MSSGAGTRQSVLGWLADFVCGTETESREKPSQQQPPPPPPPPPAPAPAQDESRKEGRAEAGADRGSDNSCSVGSDRAADSMRHQQEGRRGFLDCLVGCLQCLQMCGVCCYYFCPPVPYCVANKLAFRPPSVVSYELAGSQDGAPRSGRSIRKARHWDNLRLRPRHLYDDAMSRRGPIAEQEAFVLESRSGNILACAVFRAGRLALQDKGVRRKVAIFSQPNSSDLGQFCQPQMPGSFSNMSHFIGIDVYGYDYSGYGLSTGRPSENNVYLDLASMFEEVVRREGPDIQVLLIGFSLGTAVTIDFASKQPRNLYGVVLIAPFTSGLRLLRGNPRKPDTNCVDRFTSIDKIGDIDVPVLICHGTSDPVVPVSHGQALHDRCKHKVDPVIVEGADHQSILNSPKLTVMRAIRFFILTRTSILRAFQAIPLESGESESTTR